MKRRTIAVVALASLLAGVACKSKSNDSSSSSSSGASSAAKDEVVADFPSTDANAWVNGAAVKLGDLRGDVVLVEAWHRT